MSEHGHMNIDQQKATYANFVKMATYATAFLVVLLSIMAITLV